MSLTWPLVGRQGELHRIATAMGRSGSPGLVVSGPPGVGKTRLVGEALRRVDTAGEYAVYRAVATHAAASVPLAALAHLLPERRGRVADQAVLLRRTARHLVAQASPRRVVVAVDDAHLLDDASATLVHHLTTASPVFVLATVREGEAAPDAVTSLCKDGLAEWLPLATLDEGEVGAAVQHVLGGPVSGAVTHRLFTLSGGNPLLVTELVDRALADGRLTWSSGLWRLTGPWVRGGALPELVRERLARLDREVYAAAEVLALGEPLGVAEVESMLRPEVAAAAEREGLFTEVDHEGRQQLRLVHPLYGEALRAAITPLRARAVYRQLADTHAATTPRHGGDLLRLAVWRLEGGQTGDPDLLLRAARQDGALFDRDMAERLARAAEEAGGGLRARLVRADALRWTGHAEEADALLADTTSARTGEEFGQLAVVRAGNLYYGVSFSAL